MTTHPTTGPTATPGAAVRRPRPLSPLNHAGLALSTLLGLGDVASVFSLQEAFDPSQPGPPLEVLVFAAVMGAVTVLACALAWAGRWRTPAVRIAAVSRILSAITALPAFFVPDVPAGLVAVAGGGVLVTVVAVVLLLVRPRPRA